MVDGTSQATPQVTGLGALFLQMNPTATPAQVKQWFLNNAQPTLHSTGVNNDYTSTTSVWGGNPIMLFNPINTGTVAVFGG
jgi:subtilisin family serine protease